MKKRFSLRAGCLTLGLLLLLGGCSAGQSKAEPPINVAIIDDIVSLDVAGTKDVLSETVGRCVFSTLYTYDESLNLVPCLAQSAEQTSDREWVFLLNPDAKFHDGSPITASDVKFSIERAQSVELADKSLLAIESVEAVDPHTVRMTTVEAMNSLPSLLVRTSTSVMSQKAMEHPDYDVTHPVGSGPFKVIEWVKEKEVRLERFDDYFGEPAKSKQLNFIVETSEQNSTAALLSGQIDLLCRVSANDGDYLKLNEEIKVYETNSTKTELFIINPRIKPLDDIRVRQAIACAIDKQTVIRNVLNGYGTVQSSMIPAPLLGYANFDGYTYDVERAKALLKEAGYEDGFDLTVLTFDEQRKKLMEYLKLALAQVNIRLNYEFLELKDYLAIVERKEHMASVMSWTSNADPDSTFTQLYSKAGHVTVNQSGFTNERVEELLVLGRQEGNIERRRAIYEEANQIVAESYYVIPLYQPSVLVAARSEISGVKINPQGLFNFQSLVRNETKK